MISTHNVKDDKSYFEIFNKEEKQCIESLQDTELKTLLNSLIKIVNNGMHNSRGGWYGKIIEASETRLEIKNFDDKSEIQESAKRYIEVANKLQKPKEGMNESLYLPICKKTIIRHVNVYKAFWMMCYESSYHAFLAHISKLSPSFFSDGKGKIYIFMLLQLKSDVFFQQFLDETKIQKFNEVIDQVVQGILYKTKLGNTFHLFELERQEAVAIRNNLGEKANHLKNLQLLLESNPTYARYIHIRPAILIQYCQAIDFILTKFKNSFFEKSSLFAKTNRIAHPALQLLINKRRELIDVIEFHEKLFFLYGKDDFIEILNKIVKNSGIGFLPTNKLFDFDQFLNIRMIQYEKDDLIAPKLIFAHEHVAGNPIPRSNSTVRLDLALLGHLLTIAIKEWGVNLPANPVTNIRRPAPGAGRNRRLSPAEESRLLAAVDQHSNPMMGWIVRIALESGMRWSEILTLRKSQVDLKRRIVRLLKTKNTQPRTVPLTLSAVEMFRNAIEETRLA